MNAKLIKPTKWVKDYSQEFAVDLESISQAKKEQQAAEEQSVPIPTATPPDRELSMVFNGKGGELFVLYLTNILKIIFTLGIYHFWAKINIRNYLWGKTSFAKDPFSYHGTGAELLKGFLRLGLLIAAISGLAGVLTFFKILTPEMIILFLVLVISLSSVLVLPILMVPAWRYRLSRTSWRGIRFSFRGKCRDAMNLYIGGNLLTLITLGLYWPFFKTNTQRFWRENSYFGDKKFEFSGKGKEIFGRSVSGLILSVLTLGIYGFWLYAFLQRYFWSKTHVGGGTFKFSATGGQWFGLLIVNLLLVAVTLGLAFPWVQIRTRKFIADHLTLEGPVDLDKAIQEMKLNNAMGEEALDAFDIPLDIG
jgi:uncharacterized membrane protein YjgN (DUF898 family)